MSHDCEEHNYCSDYVPCPYHPEGHWLIENKPLQQQAQSAAKLEELLKASPDAMSKEESDSLLEHLFADGIYCRILTIPKNHALVGETHRKSTLNILLEGTILVTTESGPQQLSAPAVFVSPAGTKRAGVALTEVKWVNVHPNPHDTRDLATIKTEAVLSKEEEKLFLEHPDPEEDKDYQAYLTKLADECKCCDVCWDVPCGGCQAGGVCDEICNCEP